MKKIIITHGLISGLLVSIFMLCSIAFCYSSNNFNGNMLVGYASMILSFSLVFVGVKNFRDKQNEGVISFGKAFKIGFLIALIASSMYVIAWLVDYYFFIPDFMDKFCSQAIETARANGASTAEINAQTAEMDTYREMYKNPFGVIFLTYMEILPVGLVVSLISALILKRK
jgi:amino acid transporter